MPKKGGDTRAAAAAAGKKVGRPAKATVEQRAGKGIASEVLAMDGPPDHQRSCPCGTCHAYPKNCTCIEQCSDCGKLKENCECKKYRPLKIRCLVCHTVEEHKVCHCEICGWWEPLLTRDMRLRKETREYLTNRRDGKPAQGVFIGDTRENQVDVDFGDILMPAAPAAENQPRTARKPN
jgi:hypothetical protein